MFYFYISWKHQKTGGFRMFSGGIEVEHRLKIGYYLFSFSYSCWIFKENIFKMN